MCLVLMQNFIVSPLQCPIDHSSFLQSGFEGHHLKFLSFDPQLKMKNHTIRKNLTKVLIFLTISFYKIIKNQIISTKKTVKGTKPKTA